MKELIIKVLKTYLPYFKPETLEQIADDILEIRPANPKDAVDCLHVYCVNNNCSDCPFYAVFGCAFQMGKPPCSWKLMPGNDNE